MTYTSNADWAFMLRVERAVNQRLNRNTILDGLSVTTLEQLFYLAGNGPTELLEASLNSALQSELGVEID